MSKQTSVEFLIKEFSEILGLIDAKPMQRLLLMDAMKQAKEMEKQQIINAYLKDRPKANINKVLGTWDNAEQYYNETFKNK